LCGAPPDCSIGFAPTVQCAVSVESGLRLSVGHFDVDYYSTKNGTDSMAVFALGFQIGVISLASYT
jgi:hypothetical protein